MHFTSNNLNVGFQKSCSGYHDVFFILFAVFWSIFCMRQNVQGDRE